IKEVGLNEAAFPDIYIPFADMAVRGTEFIVRSDTPDAGVASALRAAMADPLVPVTSMSALSGRVDRALRPDRFNLIVVAGFAVMAVLTSAIGIYGAMAYAASTRRRGFGVRVALGATPRAVVRGMLWDSARLSLVAAGPGLGGALVIAKVLGNALYLVPGAHNGMLYDVRMTDPLALGTALGGILVLALVAGAVPALRAGRVEPSQALRND
ncbi:MAG: FtsX-like permease family protein, partial [Gemmatimonadaceae bacterium]